MSKNINVPKLRFKEFSVEWEEKKLNELGTFLGGGTPSRSNEFYWEGNIPWISSSDILEDNINKINISRFINPISIRESATKLIPKNSILFVSRVGVGKLAINKDELCTSQDFTNFIPKNTNSYYLGYLFQSKKSILESFNQGTSIKGFTKNDISTLKIKIPQKEEQEKIASFLISIDDKIEKLSKKDELLQEYKKAIMQKIFSQEIRFKDDNGNKFSEWEEKKLEEIGKTYNGLTNKNKENFGFGKPYIQYKQIFDNNKIDINKFELVEILSNENQNKVLFGDVFFTISSETPNEIGMSAVLLDEIEELYLNSFCFGFRANSLDELSPYYARYFFRSNMFRKNIIKLAQGSTRYNMSKIELLKLKIKLPCLEEQNKIANFLSIIDDKIQENQKLLEKAKEFKKSLLQQMFV